MSEKPEKCPKCTGIYIYNLPPWKGAGWNCGTCGHIEGKLYPLKDTMSGRDCEEDYY